MLKAILSLGGLAFILGILSNLVNDQSTNSPDEDSAYSKIKNALPGYKVYARAYAEINGKYPPDACIETEEKIGAISNTVTEEGESKICVLRCQGGKDEALDRYIYIGPRDCRSNYVLFGGCKACIYGCLGEGHCVSVCPYDAITIGPNRLPIINLNKCTACGICVGECPHHVLELIPRSRLVYLACKSLNEEDAVKKICKVGCITCNLCVNACPYEGAIVMDGSLPRIDYTKCTSCGICYNKCPTKSFIDRAKARPYAIISLQCNGCGECIKVCQFNAIEGEPNKRHTVIKDRCIGCGRCFEVCAIKVIIMAGALGYAETT